MTVLAGTTLQAAQEAAEAAGFELALDLGARGSCQIGGNLATNAGGNRVIQSGTAREQVLGIEAVLAERRRAQFDEQDDQEQHGLRPEAAFRGSEGTLGVITRRRVAPASAARGRGIRRSSRVDGYDAAVALLRSLSARFGNDIGAFEIMWPDFFDFGVSLTPSARSPFEAAYPLYALIEHAGFDAKRHRRALRHFPRRCTRSKPCAMRSSRSR